jgi:hypothetical protein
MPKLPSYEKERTKLRRKFRKERRRDEESLYYIIERDLDREVLFRGNDGWGPQVKMENGVIDFVVKYGDKILGLEVKKGFPTLDDFRQVSKYSASLDAVFLAYNSDAAAEALFLSEYRRRFLEIGLVSIALFRSHCIRPAVFSRRRNNQTWDDYFNEESYWSEENWRYKFDEDSMAATVFKDGCLWVSYDKHGRYSKDVVRLELAETEWKSLAVLYALTEAISIYKFHDRDLISKLMKEEMGWGGSYDFTKLLKAGIVEDFSYGSNLWLCSLTDTANMYKENLRKALHKNLGNNELKKIQSLIEKLKVEHSEEQKKRLREFLKVE